MSADRHNGAGEGAGWGRRPRAAPALLILVLLVAIALPGCAPTVQGFADATAQPALAGDAAVMPDGARLPVRVWPANGRPRAVVLAVHGFNDYANAFAMPAPWLAGRGITVYAYDQRGFGAAPGRGLWAGSDVLAADLRTMARLVARRHPRTPLYLLGVSMGGAVAMTALAEGGMPEIRGAVLVAPAVWGWRAMNPFYRSVLWLAAHTVPSLKPTGRGLGVRPSDNVEMLRALGADPKVIKETRIDALYGLVSLMDEANAAAADVGVPVLYLYGARDELVPEGPTLDVASRLAGPRRFVRYRRGWHMLLRDRQRRTVWRDIAAWIADRRAALPSGEESRFVVDPAAVVLQHR